MIHLYNIFKMLISSYSVFNSTTSSYLIRWKLSSIYTRVAIYRIYEILIILLLFVNCLSIEQYQSLIIYLFHVPLIINNPEYDFEMYYSMLQEKRW